MADSRRAALLERERMLMAAMEAYEYSASEEDVPARCSLSSLQGMVTQLQLVGSNLLLQPCLHP